eukprot:CAMPEP_0204227534 /NCGR_PEP_ID=MMETSP0361-20130328/85768_1 /ASSEMBLY_ACC=CAM_ASM_000343 /TAXON_ID=268821 /ORGANISM="Scrippsiella Hangoei, Strain SHTV-5" /LENGTH=89 /DNA_ID=CAMNT_0051195047 /DNA_START=502 /DNA_END=769 /DNA_ORIENTATION=+
MTNCWGIGIKLGPQAPKNSEPLQQYHVHSPAFGSNGICSPTSGPRASASPADGVDPRSAPSASGASDTEFAPALSGADRRSKAKACKAH